MAAANDSGFGVSGLIQLVDGERTKAVGIRNANSFLFASPSPLCLDEFGDNSPTLIDSAMLFLFERRRNVLNFLDLGQFLLFGSLLFVLILTVIED